MEDHGAADEAGTFKFQSDSINTSGRKDFTCAGNSFKFQSDSINTLLHGSLIHRSSSL